MKTYDPVQNSGVSNIRFKEMTSLAISVEKRGTLLARLWYQNCQYQQSCQKPQHQSSYPNRHSLQHQQIDENVMPQLLMHKPVCAICIEGYRVEGKVNGVNVLFLVDSESSVTLISKNIWEQVNIL